MLGGIGPIRAAALADHCGSPSAIFEQDPDELAHVRGISHELATKIVQWDREVNLQQELDLCQAGGVRILTREDDDYPQQLLDFDDAPLALYVRGEIPAETRARSLAIVGTRNVSNYGMRMASHIAEAAAYAGWTVVSGLAIGVDTVAHRATVNAGGKTVAVLGGGLMKLHPAENLDLAKKIVSGHGAVISEFPLFTSPTRNTFPMRNRIVSALSCGTLVVEAGLNSGSLITAARASEQGRQVFALPGEADNPNSAGCNHLIRNGAILVTCFEDILGEYDFLPGFSRTGSAPDAPRSKSRTDEPDAALDALMSENDRAILDALRSGPLSVDAVCMRTAIGAPDVIASLIALEMMHRVRKNGDETYTKLR